MKKKEIFSYQVNFEPAEVGYTATVPALPGCVSYGKTIEEATKNIKEATKLHLECLKAHKRPIPHSELKKPFYSAFVQISLPSYVK